MANETRIEWADISVNPWVGCTKVSDACQNCYAETAAVGVARKMHGIAIRMSESGGDPGPALDTADAYDSVLTKDGKWNGQTAVVESGMEKLRKLAGKRVKPKRVFVGSMTDIFHESVPDEWITELFGAMYQATQHTFLLLTKRPERWGRLGVRVSGMPHVWLGVTAENQARFDERVSAICDPCSPSYWPGKKFVSVEPCLEEVNCGKWLGHEVVGGAPDFIGDKHACTHYWQQHISWVIAGCESGPKRRPADPDWFRSLRDQCQAAGVPYFLKQFGVHACSACGYSIEDKYFGAGDPCPCGGTLRFRLEEMPYLDGRQWAEFPDGMIGGN